MSAAESTDVFQLAILVESVYMYLIISLAGAVFQKELGYAGMGLAAGMACADLMMKSSRMGIVNN